MNQILEFKSTTGNKNCGDEAPAGQEGGVGAFWIVKQRKKRGAMVGYHIQAHVNSVKERKKEKELVLDPAG